MALPKLTPFSIEAVRANSVIDENGCWIWQGSFRGKGYAQCSVYWHHSRMASRAIWAHLREEPTEEICHSCDNPACVNPDHLWHGSSWDNQQDSITKRRKTLGHARRYERWGAAGYNTEAARKAMLERAATNPWTRRGK
jgi:hypothetical protein